MAGLLGRWARRNRSRSGWLLGLFVFSWGEESLQQGLGRPLSVASHANKESDRTN